MKINYIKMIPMLLAIIMMSNLQAQDKKEHTEIHKESMTIIIPNDASDKDLKKITKEMAKEGVTLKVDKVKRNKEGVITSIHIEAKRKTENNSTSTSYSNSSDDPIQPIAIGYNSNGGLSINAEGNRMTKIFSSTKHKDGDFVFISKDGNKTVRKSKKMVIEIDEDEDKGDHHKTNNKVIYISNSGDNDNVWISEDGDTTKLTGKTMRLKTDKKGNVIRNVDKKTIKILKSNDKNFFISDDDEEKTIKINGKVVTKEELEKMDPNDIKSMEIETERHIDHDDMEHKKVFKIKTANGTKPLYYVDGKEVKSIQFISPDDIATMHILKDKKAIEKYGVKGKNGVIEIITK